VGVFDGVVLSMKLFDLLGGSGPSWLTGDLLQMTAKVKMRLPTPYPTDFIENKKSLLISLANPSRGPLPTNMKNNVMGNWEL